MPGIGSTVLAERLRKLETSGLVERQPGPVGNGVVYVLTERGRALAPALEELRRWGVHYLTDPDPDGTASREYDVRYVAGIEQLDAGEFELIVDEKSTVLRFNDGRLTQTPGESEDPETVVTTTSAFMVRWAAGGSPGIKAWPQARSPTPAPRSAGNGGWQPPDTPPATNRAPREH